MKYIVKIQHVYSTGEVERTRYCICRGINKLMKVLKLNEKFIYTIYSLEGIVENLNAHEISKLEK